LGFRDKLSLPKGARIGSISDSSKMVSSTLYAVDGHMD
jgi:hypothetical protein